jgi:hypothetical protein
MAWRAILGLVAQVTGWLAFTGPWLTLQLTGKHFFTDRYFQNLSYGVVVLCSTISLLVALRFAMTFRAESRRAEL